MKLNVNKEIVKSVGLVGLRVLGVVSILSIIRENHKLKESNAKLRMGLGVAGISSEFSIIEHEIKDKIMENQSNRINELEEQVKDLESNTKKKKV